MVRVVAATCAAALIASLAGCDGSDAERSKTAVRPAPHRSAGAPGLHRLPPGSPQRLLVDYWAANQYRASAQVLSFFAPELRESLGAARITTALEGQAGLFKRTAPEVVRVRRAGSIRRVDYRVVGTGRPTPQSISWRLVDGKWRIVYDSLLQR